MQSEQIRDSDNKCRNTKLNFGTDMKQGWEIKRLEDAVEFQRGLTYSKKDEVDFSDNIVLRSNNVDLIKNELDFTELKYINPAIEVQESKKVKKGSLLICTANGSKSHLGKVALIDDDYNYAFGGFMGQVTPKEKLDSKFLFYLMTSDNYKKFINELSDGANINNLKFSDLGQFEIPLPPLPEQQRIVSILDEAFAAIAKAKANAEQNLKNAKELFESYLKGVFEKKGDGWEECNLEDNIKLIDYRGRTPQKTESGVRLITAKNVKLGYLQLEPQEFIAEDNYESWMTRGIPYVGDVIFTTEAPLANVAQIESNEKLAFAQRIIVMQPNRKKLNPTFLKYMLLSIPIRNKILGKGTGATVVGIKSSLLKKIPIYFPKSIEEQQTIIRQLDALRAVTQKLEAVYQKKMDDLEELKKSILQKAFSGELSESRIIAD